jgi:hypothetical protein
VASQLGVNSGGCSQNDLRGTGGMGSSTASLFNKAIYGRKRSDPNYQNKNQSSEEWVTTRKAKLERQKVMNLFNET